MTEVIAKRQIEGMTRDPHRKHSPNHLPYTRVERVLVPHVEATPNGPEASLIPVHKITGYTFEYRLTDPEAGEWATVVEEHDLGQEATLPEAHEVARQWRLGLVGVYPIG